MPDQTEFVDTGWPCYRGTWIEFEPLPKGGKRTWTWQVFNCESRHHLGDVKWFGRFCKYAFWPKADCMFEEVCLHEIADFCTQRTADHRAAIFKRKP